ncbi:MAG: prolyl oligopeptidase family serine peptidase [Tannerella sp.]|jgi:dipeptidyl aminopeptidase/acylaminoacyl peptidase|nr:prolyl oligopeptidase family serine peptidase [Tannerella sp.]
MNTFLLSPVGRYVSYRKIDETTSKNHICVAAMMSLVKTPELYACGVSYSGIPDIITMMKAIPLNRFAYLESFKTVWYDTSTKAEAEIAREVSPVYQAKRIKDPLFVIQGALDRQIPITDTDRIVESLRRQRIESPYMVKYDEGPGYVRWENRVEMYKCMLGFLAKTFSVKN